ncbi:MAG TPA: S1/P1 nuclease [Sphingomonas sp.]|nr:S1/P1 nuclease [Sphingomonas sp.]
MVSIRTVIVGVASIVAASPAHAYWEFGHQTIARIAQANVAPRTRTAIRRLLAQSALLDTPSCPAATIEEASVWADCIKPLKGADGKRRFDYAYNWHFQNVNVCAPFDLMPACKDGDCVSAQIDRDVAILKDRRATPKQRVEALAFLIHFVGDLHQPLHAGDRADKGGNEVTAHYGVYAPKRFNLHSVWDGPLAERAITSGPSLVRRYPAAERHRVAAGDVTRWSREAWQLSRRYVYGSAAAGDPCAAPTTSAVLDDATVARLVPIARLEVKRGGLRLAKLLDAALG